MSPATLPGRADALSFLVWEGMQQQELVMSLLRTFGNRIIEARQRQARAQVNAILRSWNPELRQRVSWDEDHVNSSVYL